MIDASRIAAIFERFTTGFQFYLQDLRSGACVELGEAGPWPIGSCFKLAVLVAYQEALADGTLPPGSLDAENLIGPRDFSSGAGIINLLSSPIRLTDRHLLEWMLAGSDGTATDILIGKVGLNRVQATLARLAPESTLDCNLHGMIERFQRIEGALDCKTRQWTKAAALTFRKSTCRLGQTNARDLAQLAIQTYSVITGTWTGPLPIRRVWPRTDMFMGSRTRTFAKTGSLGFRYFTAEAGVILDGDSAVATFGYCSEGWRLPAFLVESICGLVGLQMAIAMGLDHDVNRDWTPEGAQLLLGDLP